VMGNVEQPIRETLRKNRNAQRIHRYLPFFGVASQRYDVLFGNIILPPMQCFVMQGPY
jgi:hypothetical protein